MKHIPQVIIFLFVALCGATFLTAGVLPLFRYTAHQPVVYVRAHPITHQRTVAHAVRMFFVGDMMLDRNVKEIINEDGDAATLFTQWGLTSVWQSADIVSTNIEGAITLGGEHYPPALSIDFAFDHADVAVLREFGFNTVTIANNHVLDQGQQGFHETQAQLQHLGFIFAGCPDRAVDTCSVTTKQVGDITVGFANYSMVYGLLDEAAMQEQVSALASTTDIVVAQVHWGEEYTHQHNSQQERVAHKLVDAGADLIIGHHPHVAQDVEVYNGVPIFYSLGNFIFDQYFSKETQEGLAIGVTFTYDDQKQEVLSLHLNLFPYYSERSRPQLMNGERREQFLTWLSELSDFEEIKNGSLILN